MNKECPCLDWEVWRSRGHSVVKGHHSQCDGTGIRVLPVAPTKDAVRSWDVRTINEHLHQEGICTYPTEVIRAIYMNLCQSEHRCSYELSEIRGLKETVRALLPPQPPKPKLNANREQLIAKLTEKHSLVAKTELTYVGAYLQCGSVSKAAKECGVTGPTIRRAVNMFTRRAMRQKDGLD